MNVHRDKLKVKSIAVTIQRGQVKRLGHVARMGKDILTRSVYEAKQKEREKEKAEKNLERRSEKGQMKQEEKNGRAQGKYAKINKVETIMEERPMKLSSAQFYTSHGFSD